MEQDLVSVGAEQDGYRFVGGDPSSPYSWEPLDLKIGTVDDGYRFRGGDPSMPANWEKFDQAGGFVASVKSGVGAALKGAGQAAADFIPGVGQDNALKAYGQEVIEANPTAVRSLEDIKDKPGTAVAEAAGNAGGSVAQMLAARAVGSGITMAAPLTGPAAPVVALV